MRQFDVFNGDADGLCALHQLRLAEPRPEAEIVTGVKRDIRLLSRVAANAGDHVNVLDISLATNRADLERLLAAGARVRYFDHHFAGAEPFDHPGLERHIDTAPDVCTSLLVDRWLNGAHRLWAVTAAFGDDMAASARRVAEGLDVTPSDLEKLEALGQCLNYNGYGETLDDLWFHPAELYAVVRPFRDPRAFIAGSSAFRKLRAGYDDDLRQATSLVPRVESAGVAAFELPDAPWARRVSGVLANRLAQGHPGRAHAVFTPAAGRCYTVSVRAPRSKPFGADTLCLRFPGGGGRAAAAGINGLPESQLPAFLEALVAHFEV